MENEDLAQALKDWADLTKEYVDLQALHGRYVAQLAETIALQKKCIAGVKHQRYRLAAIRAQMSGVRAKDAVEKGEMVDLDKDILRRKAQLSQMEDSLPRESGRYLKIILGDINVSILDKKAKYDYKDKYERFKLIVNLVAFVLAILCLSLGYRVLDLLFHFLTVWYYCTLTIRESILKVNGSRIKGWWRLHHFVSTFAGGVLLILPDGPCYRSIRVQLMWFNVYVAFLQYLQFTYQRGVLYRLRSLGERMDMDITIDGFHSWMWKGLGFLLPFLYLGYFFQLYNAHTLHVLSFSDDASWHISVLAAVFLLLGTGNIITTSGTIPAKIKERRKGLLKMRFTRLDKYFWRHRRRRDSASVNKKYSEDINKILDRTIPKDSDSSIEEEEENEEIRQQGPNGGDKKRD